MARDLPDPCPAESGARPPRMSFRRYLATSDERIPRAARWLRRRVNSLSVPAPRMVVRPMLWTFLAIRFVCYFVRRVFIAEPLFKAYCTKYGKNLRTGIFIHWVQGKGDIILGDDVWIDGKCSFTFAHRFVDRPTLQIGDGTGIGHNCSLIVGKRIIIGRRCMIASDTTIFGSSGHSTNLEAPRLGRPPSENEARDVVIGDSVWIGRRVLIFPGVKIGEGSVISAGSVVRTHVPPYAVVAGNPAKVLFRLKKPSTVPVSSPGDMIPGECQREVVVSDGVPNHESDANQG